MLKKCSSNEELCTLIDYIGKEYRESLYLYLDAKKYGLLNPNVSSWIQKEKEVITAVVLVYHTGMHIYSRYKVFNIDEMVTLILEQNPSIICAEESIINCLSVKLPSYKSELGYVAQYRSCDLLDSPFPIRKATPSDYKQMAKMLLSDEEIGASYNLNGLIKQIDERIKDGYSRSYCMFDGDRLIAQASTGAEESGVATIAYVMTDFNYRGRGLGKSMVSYLANSLLNEGFKVFLVYYSKDVARLYLKLGFENVCRYGKLYKDI